MDLDVGGKISTLLAAREAMRSEMARLAQVRPLDRAGLERLRKEVHGWADQADALILSLVMQKAPDSLVAAVEEIFDMLRDAEGQIQAAMRRRR